MCVWQSQAWGGMSKFTATSGCDAFPKTGGLRAPAATAPLGMSRRVDMPAIVTLYRDNQPCLPVVSALLFEQLIEFPPLLVVEDSQNPGFSIAQHVPVIHTEIVQDHGHFLRLFGSQLEVPL